MMSRLTSLSVFLFCWPVVSSMSGTDDVTSIKKNKNHSSSSSNNADVVFHQDHNGKHTVDQDNGNTILDPVVAWKPSELPEDSFGGNRANKNNTTNTSPAPSSSAGTNTNNVTSPAPSLMPPKTPVPITNSPTPSPTSEDDKNTHDWWEKLEKLIIKTVLWLIVIFVFFFGFVALFSNRFRIYYYVKGWCTECFRRVRHRSERDEGIIAPSVTLNEIIFSQDEDEGDQDDDETRRVRSNRSIRSNRSVRSNRSNTSNTLRENLLG